MEKEESKLNFNAVKELLNFIEALDKLRQNKEIKMVHWITDDSFQFEMPPELWEVLPRGEIKVKQVDHEWTKKTYGDYELHKSLGPKAKAVCFVRDIEYAESKKPPVKIPVKEAA